MHSGERTALPADKRKGRLLGSRTVQLHTCLVLDSEGATSRVGGAASRLILLHNEANPMTQAIALCEVTK